MKGHRLILIISVIVLSFAGVGYSAWTEGLSIKSIFETGDIHILFENSEIVDSGQGELYLDVRDGILEINGTVAPDTVVLVEYDIYNDSSIPVKYQPDDDETLPEGIAFDLDDTVIAPGEYLRDNQLTIEPGENELILPFVQYNSNGRSGWKEDIKICWNITIIEETVDPLLVNGITEGAIEGAPPAEEEIVGVPPAGETEGTSQEQEQQSEGEQPSEEPAQESPAAEPAPAVDPPSDPAPTGPEPASNPPEETPAAEPPSESPSTDGNSEDNTQSDQGSEENVNNESEANANNGSE